MGGPIEGQFAPRGWVEKTMVRLAICGASGAPASLTGLGPHGNSRLPPCIKHQAR